MMLSMAKHTMGIRENSTSCYSQIVFDPSAEGGGGSALIYVKKQFIQTNFKLLVMKCLFLTFNHCRPVITIKRGCTLAIRVAAADNQSAILIIMEG